MELQIETITSHHDRSSFNCGNQKLNEFIKKYANQNHKRNFSKTFVAVSESEEKKVLGFYTLSSGKLQYNALPEELKHPQYPISVVRLARLAVDSKYQGQGVAGFLLYDALRRVKVASELLGIFAVAVDAKNEKAKSFYRHYGFLDLEASDQTMCLPMSSINRL